MRILVATLCDFAQVREGLLFVLSGGISRVWRENFPAPMGVMLALTLEVSPGELANVVEIRSQVEDGDGAIFAEMTIGAQGQAPEIDAGELVQVPLVFDLRNVGLPHSGRYMVRTWSPQGDEVEEVQLSFAARPPPTGTRPAKG